MGKIGRVDTAPGCSHGECHRLLLNGGDERLEDGTDE